MMLLMVVGIMGLSACGDGNFAGSCSESAQKNILCVDYYDGYTEATAKQTCASTAQNTFGTETCEKINTTWTKVAGKCKVIENLNKDRTSKISYYTGGYNATTALAHCNAYKSIAGYSSEWLAGE